MRFTNAFHSGLLLYFDVLALYQMAVLKNRRIIHLLVFILQIFIMRLLDGGKQSRYDQLHLIV